MAVLTPKLGFVVVEIMVLVCYLILQDYLTKGSWDFLGESLIVSHHPATFGAPRYRGDGDKMVLACHVI